MKQCAGLKECPVCPFPLFCSFTSSLFFLSVHLDSSSSWWCGTLSSAWSRWLCCSCWPGITSSSLRERTADRETWWVNLHSRFGGISAFYTHTHLLFPLILVKRTKNILATFKTVNSFRFKSHAVLNIKPVLYN